jgi:hypothetical protein
MAGTGWDRREFLNAAALLALAIGVPAGVVGVTGLDPEEAPSDRQRAMIREVAQAVLPRTDTPGAGEVGVGDFVILALAHGLDGTRAPAASAATPYALAQHRRSDGSLRYLEWLEAALDRAAHGDWLGKPEGRRAALLTELDGQAFAENAGEHPWKKVKGLILTGYYTSEVGGSQELRYELVPGRYDPAVPLAPGDRAWSSDWTAVEFG